MFICNICLTFVIKRLINGIHKTFLKHSITNGFCTHHFLTFAKRFLSNVYKTQKLFTGQYNLLTKLYWYVLLQSAIFPL